LYEIISNTSPLQYLHQLGALDVLPKLVGTITVPPAVQDELSAGRKLGLNLPDIQSLDWINVRRPSSSVALPMVTDLGAGEREVLALALESADAVCVLDDALARQVACALQLRITGTLGVLIDAKRAGLISAVRPQLDQLDSLGFRLAPHTRIAVLKIAGEYAG
jgi:predicted nucleic acid-binding protein